MKFYKVLAVILAMLLSILCVSACAAHDTMEERFEAPNMAPEAGDSVNLEINDSSVNKSEGSLNGESEYERKIIRTANVNAETTKFDESLEAITLLCQNSGGYIEKSSQSGISIDSKGKNVKRRASLTIRIPSESFDAFNSELDGMLNVTSSSTNSNEITSQYYDIQSRIEVLELQKDSLQKMYDNYTNYQDIDSLLRLQDQLYSVIEEIESYKTKLKLYDNKVAYSTVQLNLTEVVEYTAVEEESFFTEIKNAFLSGCEFAATLFRWVAIAIAAASPVLIPVVLIIAIIGAIFTVSVKSVIRRKKRKAEKKLREEQTNV